jgi:hypothetical protein
LKVQSQNQYYSIDHSFIVNLDYTIMSYCFYRRRRSDRTFDYVNINSDIYEMSRIDRRTDDHGIFTYSIE